MRNLFPPQFVTAEAQLTEVFVSVAAGFGIGHEEAEHLFNLLPVSVKDAPAIKVLIGDDWRYAFGKPFHLKGDSKGFGVPFQAPLVASLVRAIRVAERTLTTQQFHGSWRRRLDMPAKHFDAIVEMLAVCNVASESQLVYEQLGLGAGPRLIDWALTTESEGKILLEVKNRPGQPAKELSRLQTNSGAVDGIMNSDPIPDFDALFKSTCSKFVPLPTSCIQGVVVFTGIKVPAVGFESYFHDHLQAHLHFAALGKEDKESGISVNLIAISPGIADRVLTAFAWRNDADLTS
jgi:hypothetical protein